MSPVARSLFEVNASVLLLGLVPLFAKLIPLDAVSIITWRSLIGAAALIAWLAWRRERWWLQGWRHRALVVLLGVIMAVHWSTYFQAIQVATVAVAVVAMFTWPVMAVLIEPLFHGGGWRARDLGLAALALVGVALVVPELSLASEHLAGALWGLGSALLFAVRNVLHRCYLTGYPGTLMMAWQLVVIVLCLATFSRPPAAAGDWGLLVLLGAVFTAFAHSLFVTSMRHLPAKSAGMISCLQPVYGIVAAALVLGEVPPPLAVLGALLVLGVAAAETAGVPRRSATRDLP
ncbi:DMT family transporter [Arhodomonas sp. SL1]|uniref:DMT family transporter n=1 Tax=Arhodomonas sp. SL1 TaxID=3425691 RepID=UPI003F883E17